MILSFKQKFDNGNPTYFVSKIWRGLTQNGVSMNANEFVSMSNNCVALGHDIQGAINGKYGSKIHTIRIDRTQRWKSENKIHFFLGRYTDGERFQFAPVVKCTSVQTIQITYWMGCGDYPGISIDGRNLSYSNGEVLELAKNDGFKTEEEFLQYFKEDFTGKIIHWTDLKY